MCLTIDDKTQLLRWIIFISIFIGLAQHPVHRFFKSQILFTKGKLAQDHHSPQATKASKQTFHRHPQPIFPAVRLAIQIEMMLHQHRSYQS